MYLLSPSPSPLCPCQYTIVFRDSCVILPSQEQLEGCPIHHVPLAVHVPMNPEAIVSDGAFPRVPRLRHVSVESGLRLIGAGAKLSAASHCQTAGHCGRRFRQRLSLLQTANSVSAPGCRVFGYKAFAECCSLYGCMHRKGLQIGSAAKPNSGIAFFKDAST